MKFHKQLIGACLAACALAVSCAAVAAEPADQEPAPAAFQQEADGQKATLGLDKGENMAAVICDVFGYDLGGYQYVSFAQLWDKTQVTSATQPMRSILLDTCAAIQAGENIPLGYLYQGNTVYTAVEQPDGSLQLTQYEVQPAPTPQSANGAERATVLPDYRVVETETRAVNQASVEALYE